MPIRSLHGLAFRLQHDSKGKDLSEGQEWLWRTCIDDLEWRSTNAASTDKRCFCELCFVHPTLDELPEWYGEPDPF
jgi:hypothetical protein